MSPSSLTSDYIQPIDTCNQTYELPALSVNSANPCGPTVCCVECMTCFDNMKDIFNEAGKINHYANMLMQYTANFDGCKNHNFRFKCLDFFFFSFFFLFFALKHRLWVHVRTDSMRQFQRVTTIYVLEQK